MSAKDADGIEAGLKKATYDIFRLLAPFGAIFFVALVLIALVRGDGPGAYIGAVVLSLLMVTIPMAIPALFWLVTLLARKSVGR